MILRVEATRLCLTQTLLHGCGFGPLQSIKATSPICIASLLILIVPLEGLAGWQNILALGPPTLISNLVLSFALNVSSVFLIDLSSLVMSLSKVTKDILLIAGGTGQSTCMARVLRLKLTLYFFLVFHSATWRTFVSTSRHWLFNSAVRSRSVQVLRLKQYPALTLTRYPIPSRIRIISTSSIVHTKHTGIITCRSYLQIEVLIIGLSAYSQRENIVTSKV